MFTFIGNLLKKTTILVVIIIIGLIVVNSSFGTIGAGQRGILLRFGAVTGTVFNEGLYFKIPLIEDVKKIDVKVQKEQTEASSASKDLQAVHAVVALNFHIIPTQVGKIYQEIGIDYKDKLIDPAIQESVKASTAKFTAEELISKREIVRAEMKKLLTDKLSVWGINVDDVNIVNFNFSESFNTAIESKVTAEQDALASKNKLERIKFEAEQRIVEAKGKAEAMRVESEALKSNPEVLQLRALEKWNGVLPQVTGTSIPFVNITGLGK
ncbi:MAG: prohibitin family protein [Candidatus Gracilibacteria bacterium]|nr:prohibitin family protein [Candidatus Gracilibacteria bacterium]